MRTCAQSNPWWLVKPSVFGGDNGVLEIERDAVERNESVALVIRSLAAPGLDAALDMDRGERWVDPTQRD
jgi:hypothetical protein